MNNFLVIDDSTSIRTRLAGIIRALEPAAVIEEAADEAAALASLERVKPDVVFLDMMLTDEGGGLQVGAAIIDKLPEVKVVVLTGLSADAPMVRKAISMGAFAYLQKPIRRQNVQELFDSFDFEADRLRRIK